MTTALIYVRQSKETEGSVSPETQEAACRRLPAVVACDTAVMVYRDLGISGGKPPEKRPDFLALRDRVAATDRTHEPLVIATYDQSRLSRSNVDSAAFYAFIENRLWVELVMVDGHFDRSPSGEFTWAMMAATATHLRKLTGKKIKAAYALRNAQGAPTGPVPAGYKRIGSRAQGQVVIDETSAPLIRRIFADYASGGWSTRALAHRLNAEGAIIDGSKGWYGDTVAQVLGNVAYSGRTYSISRRRRQGDLIPAQWPALIDRPTWEAVQRQLQAKRGRRGLKASSQPGREYAFRGLMVCGSCGRRMAIHNDHDRTYYRCRGVDAPDRCQGPWSREEKLLAWGEELFCRLDAFRRSDFAERVTAEADLKPPGPGALAQVEATLERLGKRYEWGHLTEAAYRVEYARLEAVRNELVATFAPASPPVELEGLLDAWQTGIPSIRRELLGRLFDGLEVKGGQIIRYIPRKDREAAVANLVDQAWPSQPQEMGFSGAGGI